MTMSLMGVLVLTGPKDNGDKDHVDDNVGLVVMVRTILNKLFLQIENIC